MAWMKMLSLLAYLLPETSMSLISKNIDVLSSEKNIDVLSSDVLKKNTKKYYLFNLMEKQTSMHACIN